jgi:predicted RNA-binding protein
MGFYGNITNTSRTQFQFDKTFPNRATMDNFVGTDGVYIGRYVLVEYDKELAADWCAVAYMKSDETGIKHFYKAADLNALSELVYGKDNITEKRYIRVPGSFYDTDGTYISYNKDNPEVTYDIIFEILEESIEGQPPVVVNVATKDDPKQNDYIINFNIDRDKYHVGRGYDSTVWQKVYTDQKERYVMIAELNSVVPTFGVSADAPTMSPMAPHFDVDSTNMFYRVHWQPSWGLRVRAAAPVVTVKPTDEAGTTVLGSTVTITNILESAFPSDETTVWKRSTYDTRTGTAHNFYYDPNIDPTTKNMYGEWRESQAAPANANFPAAIYYNKAGFDPAVISYSDKTIHDKISIEPTGLSGQNYNVHQTSGLKEPQIDTQELTILLPSIGDSIAKVWDIMYGNEKINNSKKRNMNIDWTQGSIVPNLSGLRLVPRTETGYGFNRNNVSTVAGAINSIHDLMGMIIKDEKTFTSASTGNAVKALNDDYIYYLEKEHKYARKVKKYNYTPIESFTKDECFTKVTFDDNWTFPHSNYYLDYPINNPTNENGDQFPNIILEKNVRHEDDRQYYASASLNKSANQGPYTTEDFDGTFEAFTFFVRGEKEIQLNGNKMTVPAYQISLDETYQNSSTYYIITHESLGDNTRFWVQEEYLVGTFTEYKNHTATDFNNRILFEKVTVDGKVRYLRPSTYSEESTYYTGVFATDSGNYSSSKQYFTIDKRIENNKTYIERTTYEPTAVGEVTAENFYYRNYYITSNRVTYELATVFDPREQYYTKKVTLELVEGNVSVSASDVNEVNVVLFEPNQGYCKYIPKGMGGSNGYAEYIVLSNPLIPTYANSENLVKITLQSISNIYQPNLYYYQITDANDPLNGSIVFDANILPTQGREYYTRYGASYSGPLDYTKTVKVYKPFNFYYKDGTEYILDTSENRVENREYYIKNNGIYVIEDKTGKFPKGMEWNLNINTIPNGVTLGRRTETWGFEELYGFARHFNTIHGLILRLTKALESNNSLIRDYDTVQGVINKMKDLLVQFGEMYANQIVVTDKFGRLTSTTLQGDEWIKPSYADKGKIIINHQNVGEVNSKTLEVKANATTTVPFGGSFTSPSFSIGIDAAGHADSFNTSNNTLTLHTITFSDDDEGNIVSELEMSGANSTAITFTKTKVNIGSVKLGTYTAVSGDTLKITSETTLASAINKISAHINGLDYSMNEANNTYVSAVTETDGKIKVSTASTTSITSLGTVTSGIWNSTIAKDRVTTDSIKDENVTNDKLASGIDASKLTTGTLPAARIENNSIASEKISSLNASKLTGTLNMDRIGAEAITNAKLASDISASKVKLTNYAISTTAGDLSASNTLLQAVAILEKRVKDLEAQVTALLGTGGI